MLLYIIAYWTACNKQSVDISEGNFLYPGFIPGFKNPKVLDRLKVARRFA